MTNRVARLVLHIGQHKTGSTALQKCLARNRAELGREGILYPRLGPLNHAHHALVPALVGLRPVALDIRERLGTDPLGRSAQLYDELRQMLDRTAVHTVVLSSEVLFNRLEPQEMVQMAARLSDIAERIEIVCYLRHPADYLLSVLSSQVLRTPTLRMPNESWQVLVVESYAHAPKFTISVTPYSDKSVPDGDVIKDFAERVLQTGVSLRRAGGSGESNQALSAEAMCLAQEFARRVRASRDVSMSLSHRLFRKLARPMDKRIAGYRRPALRPGLAEEVVRYTKGLRRLRDDWGCVFPGLDYDAAGTGSRVEFGALTEVGDFCRYDEARLRRLRLYFGWLLPNGRRSASF